VVLNVLSRATALVGAGAIAGVVISLWASRFADSLVYGISPRDPATFIGAALVLVSSAIVAAAFPAWRASSIDPAVTLRSQ
jgi:ABC-type antimicrobial peptide transport system permease subunit